MPPAPTPKSSPRQPMTSESRNLPHRQSHCAWLTSEMDRLDAKLRAAEPEEIAARMALLFAALPVQTKGEDESVRAKAYLFALDGVSLSALDAVTRGVLQGKIPSLNPTF